MGIKKCCQRTREVVYCPELNAHISNMVENCNTRLKYQPNVIPTNNQNHCNHTRFRLELGSESVQTSEPQAEGNLVVSLYYSGYPEVVTVTTTTNKSALEALKSMFARHGVPGILIMSFGSQGDGIFISENGPQFGRGRN